MILSPLVEASLVCVISLLLALSCRARSNLVLMSDLRLCEATLFIVSLLSGDSLYALRAFAMLELLSGTLSSILSKSEVSLDFTGVLTEKLLAVPSLYGLYPEGYILSRFYKVASVWSVFSSGACLAPFIMNLLIMVVYLRVVSSSKSAIFESLFSFRVGCSSVVFSSLFAG